MEQLIASKVFLCNLARLEKLPALNAYLFSPSVEENLSTHQLLERFRTTTVDAEFFGPEKLRLLDCPQRDFLMADQKQLYISWVMCRKFYKDQYIPTCAGYKICARRSEVILESSISYLECIYDPATDISTVNKVLE